MIPDWHDTALLQRIANDNRPLWPTILSWIALAVGTLSGGFFVLLFADHLQHARGDYGSTIEVAVMLGPIPLLALAIAWWGWDRGRRGTPAFMHVLAQRPETVAWLDLAEIRNRHEMSGSRFIRLGLRSGEVLWVRVPRDGLVPAWNEIARLCPDAQRRGGPQPGYGMPY